MTSIGRSFETIEIENRVLGHSTGNPFPPIYKIPPFIEPCKDVSSTSDLTFSIAELLSPSGSFLALTL